MNYFQLELVKSFGEIVFIPQSILQINKIFQYSLFFSYVVQLRTVWKRRLDEKHILVLLPWVNLLGSQLHVLIWESQKSDVILVSYIFSQLRSLGDWGDDRCILFFFVRWKKDCYFWLCSCVWWGNGCNSVASDVVGDVQILREVFLFFLK